MRQTILLWAILLTWLAGCAAPELISAPSAQAALINSWQAAQHTVWEIDWPAAPTGGPLTVEIWQAGPRYRLEILEAVAPDLVGQVLIYDGQAAWHYNRFDQPPAPSQMPEAQLSPVTDAFAIITRQMTATVETASQEVVQMSSGPANKTTLNFANGDSFTLWRNQSTNLPVQVEFVLGGQPASLRARSFEALPNPPDALFKLRYPTPAS